MKKTKDTGPAQNGWLAELEGRVGSRMREYERRETTFMCETVLDCGEACTIVRGR